ALAAVHRHARTGRWHQRAGLPVRSTRDRKCPRHLAVRRLARLPRIVAGARATDMTEAEALAYVQAAARASSLPLDAAAAQRVAQHLARTSALARLLERAEL